LVLPQYQRQGVGTAFIRYLINSRYHNFVALKLEVLPYNTRALKLYESLGFSIADRHHLIYTP
jgi:ribosomal protein S18 acetylase RimI-like enzyme